MINQDILQPNPKNSQQDVDWEKVFSGYYDSGASVLKARRMLRRQYPDVWENHNDDLISFYDSKKKIQEDTPQSDASSGEVSTESTSDTDQQTQQKNGDSDSTIKPLKIDTIEALKPTPIPAYQLLDVAPVVFDTDQEYIKKFGDGPVFKLNPNRLLTEQRDDRIFIDLQIIEENSFDRWYTKYISDKPRLQADIKSFLNDPNNSRLKEHIDLGLPLFYVKEGIMDMLGALDYKPGEEDDAPYDPVMSRSGRYVRTFEEGSPGEKYTGKKISNKTKKRFDKSYNDFFRDMVLESLPAKTKLNEDHLKDLEYYFRMGSDNLFDFTGDKEIGNKTWWQDSLTSAELGALTFVNKMDYILTKMSSFLIDDFILQDMPQFQGLGQAMEEDALKMINEREKYLNERRASMNVFEENITNSLSNFFSTGDLTSLNNYFEQSFLMTVEASPQIAMAVGGAAAGLGPAGLALMMTADGIATEAYTIRNDISFDDFINKETGEKLSYYEAIENIEVSEGDTMDDLRNKLKDKYTIETNNSRRGIYLGSVAAIDFTADRITFGIAARAMRNTKFDPFNQSNRELMKNLLIGAGVAIPEGSIPTMISTFNRELQKQGQTGDPNWDAYEAFQNSIEVMLGTIGIGPGMHALGSAKAYIKHLANSKIGVDGMNAYHRKLLEDLEATANDPHTSSKDRMEAMKMINELKKEGRALMRRQEAFLEYVGQRSRADLDEITNIDLRLQRLANHYNTTKNPDLKIRIKNKMADLIKAKSSLEGKYMEGFDNSYEVKLKEPVAGKEYTVRFDEEGGIVKPKDDADVKPKDEGDADVTPKDEGDADVTPEGEAQPVVTPDDANKQVPDKPEAPLEGEPRNGDTDKGVEAEEESVASFKGGWLRKLYRETFRTDAGVGGSRGLKFWKKRPYEDVSEKVLEQARLKSALEAQVAMDLGMLDAIVQDFRFDVNGRKVDKGEYGRRQVELNKYLSGDPNARVAFLSDAQKAKVDYLRGRIDGASADIIRLLEENPTPANKELVKKIKENEGHYLRRSYEAFTDDGSWINELTSSFKKMPADKQILFDDAVEFIMNQEGFEGTRFEARQMVTDYLRDIKNKMSSGRFAYGSGTLGALDTKMFAGRKDIPEPFRKLLGEIENTNFNYVNTMHRLTGYVADLKYQKVLKNLMLKLGIASETPIQGLQPLTEGNAYSGLDGLYVDPTFRQMYEAMMPLPVSPSRFWRTVHGLQGAVKIGKTQYSPTTTSRNLISGIFLGMNSGHFFMSNPDQIKQAATMAWGDLNVINENPILKAESLKLIEKGVLGDSARGREVMNLLRDWSDATEANRLAQQQGGSAARKALRRLNDITSKMYAFGDDFFKVTGYYIEINKLLRDDPNMTKAEAEDIAANRIRNGYPTYSMIPRNIKKLRRFPLAGMFVSFPYEVYRTTGNNLRFIAEDLKAGRTRMAMERMLGMTASASLGFGLYSYTKDIFEYDDEDVDAIRMHGSSFSKDSRPMFMPGEEDEINFIDLRSFLPQEQIIAPILTLLGQSNPEDADFMERVESSLLQFTEAFTAQDATAEAVFEIHSGKSLETGQPIYYYDQDKTRYENIVDNATAISTYLMRKVGPGVYNNIVDFFRANEIAPEIFGTKETPWKEYTNEEALIAVGGFRVQSLDLKSSLLINMRESFSDMQDYESWHMSKSDIRLWENKDDKYLTDTAYEYADKQIAVAKRATKYTSTAVKSKMTQEELAAALFDAGGVKKVDARILYVNATEDRNMPLSPRLIKGESLKTLYKYLEDSNRNASREELNEKFENLVESVIIFNLKTIERWKSAFPEYKLENDKENRKFYNQVNKK